MTHAAYVFGGYVATFAVLTGYVAWVRARARSLGRLVPSEGAGGRDEAPPGGR